jgi:hypothetical protein
MEQPGETSTVELSVKKISQHPPRRMLQFQAILLTMQRLQAKMETTSLILKKSTSPKNLQKTQNLKKKKKTWKKSTGKATASIMQSPT